MTYKYLLREATIADHDIIYKIKKQSVQPYVEDIWGWDEDFQIKDFDCDYKNIDQFQVIELNDEFIGFLQVYVHDIYVELVEIHLLSDKRGLGIGSSIIKSIINYAIANNKIVRLGCFKKNFGAKSLYIRLGFKQVAETDNHYILEYKD